jgi:hypothetical protein
MIFKPPIFYNKEKVELSPHIIKDLELVTTQDEEGTPISSYLFSDKPFQKSFISHYTTDINFLKDTQHVLRKWTNNKDSERKRAKSVFQEIKSDTGFKEKYYYIDWTMWEFLNKSERFLQLMSMYNLASPLISLCVPLIILIVPFFIIKMKGMSINMNEYITILKNVLSNHAIGKLFTEFGSVSLNEKIYLVVSAAFYVFSIYQNILVCIRFNSNMEKIHGYLKSVELYLDESVAAMTNFLSVTDKLGSYSEFNANVLSNMKVLIAFKHELAKITEYKSTNYKKVTEIGHLMKCFYDLYQDPVYNDALEYSFGFAEYLDCLSGIQENLQIGAVHFAQFTNDKKKAVLKNNYYATLSGDKGTNLDEVRIKKNTISLKKNMTITGPNASGKTTVLKSVLINILFSQQFGCGFYDEGTFIKVYKHIHCYLNIPDTSGRDSLFQAEARRCKEILDSVQEDEKEDHLCVFDELYSGTNPDEAISSATAFLDYLMKRKSVTLLLTTHFLPICKNLEGNKRLTNYRMMVDQKSNNELIYLYTMEKGISGVKGCYSVLKGLNYPAEILMNSIRSVKQ